MLSVQASTSSCRETSRKRERETTQFAQERPRPAKLSKGSFFSSSLDPEYQKRLLTSRQSSDTRLQTDRFITPRPFRNLEGFQIEASSQPKTMGEKNYEKLLSQTLFGSPGISEQRILSSKNAPKHSIPSLNDYRTVSGYQSAWGSSLSLSAPKATAPQLPFENQFSSPPFLAIDIDNVFDDFYLNRLAYCQNTQRVACAKVVTEGVDCADQVLLTHLFKKESKWTAICEDKRFAGKQIQSLQFLKSDLLIGSMKTRIEDPTQPPKCYLEFWNESNGKWSCYEEIEIESGAVNFIVPSKETLLIGGMNGVVQELSLANRKVLTSYPVDPGKRICNGVLSPSGRYFAVGTNSDMVVIIDLLGKKIVNRFQNLGAGVRAIAFNPFKESEIAFGGGAAKPSLYVYNFLQNTLYVETNLKKQCTGLFWTKDNVLISTHEQGRLKFTPINREHVLGEPIMVDCEFVPSGRLSYPHYFSKNRGRGYLLMAQGSRAIDPTSKMDHKIIVITLPESRPLSMAAFEEASSENPLTPSFYKSIR